MLPSVEKPLLMQINLHNTMNYRILIHSESTFLSLSQNLMVYFCWTRKNAEIFFHALKIRIELKLVITGEIFIILDPSSLFWIRPKQIRLFISIESYLI